MERTDLEQWRAREVARLLALVETERRYYQEIVAALPVALVVLSADRQIASANRSFRQLFSLRIEDLRGKTIDQLLPSERLIEKIRDVHTSGIPQPLFFLEQADRLLRIAIVPIRNWDDESELETLLMVEDTGEFEPPEAHRTRAEVEAPSLPTASPEKQVFDAMPAIAWEADAATLAFREVHGITEELLGYPVAHWLGAPEFFTERIHADDRAATLALYQSAISRKGDASAEFRGVTAEGGSIWLRETIRVEGGAITGVITAIEKRKQMEHQLLRAGRAGALQSLASRLAHDLNNPLMIVTGYTEEIRDSFPESDSRRGDAEQILSASHRISGIAAQLLGFTRRQAFPPSPLNVSALLASVEEKIAHEAGENIAVQVKTGKAIWAMAEEAQLEQIMLTLASGLRDDAQERSRVVIECGIETIAEQVPGSTLVPGDYARISIQDNGRGVDLAKSDAVFESFLSREPVAAALARAYATAREWGGDIAFSSEPSHGSTFVVYLPACAAPMEGEAGPEHGRSASSEQSEEEPPAPVVRETILVVEDEAGIRALVRKILRREQYNVLEAGSAEEALTIASSVQGRIDLLMTDAILPGATGRSLAEKLRETRADLKVLYVSGYTDDEAVRAGTIPPGSKFLQKPFTLGALVSKVAEALRSE